MQLIGAVVLTVCQNTKNNPSMMPPNPLAGVLQHSVVLQNTAKKG
jgi:hypothetical protein